MHSVAIAASALVAVAATYTDMRWRRIPNVLTVPAAVAGCIFWLAADGVEGLVRAVGGAGLAVLIFVLLGLLGRVLGGGDGKLMMAIGAWTGPKLFLIVFAASAIIGGLLAILVALARGRLGAVVVRIVQAVAARLFARQPLDYRASSGLRLPYAVSFALGVAFVAVAGRAWWGG